jgi:membrane-associated phospholipid phosphatase
METLQQFGISLIQALQTLSPTLDGVMFFFTFLGRVEFYLLIAPFIYWTIDKRLGIRVLLILVATDVITSSFKLFFHQPRPYWFGGVQELSQEASYGIPSGHASDSLAVGGYLAYHAKKNWFWVVTSFVIFFIGLSRLYLGVHFLHDVLFGWLIGASVLWVGIKQSNQIAAWARSRSLTSQVGIGFILSLTIILLAVLARVVISETVDPASWSQFSVDARSIAHSFTLAGALFGAVSGYALMRQKAGFQPDESSIKRGFSYALGIIILLLIYEGLDVAFAAIAADETVPGYLLRYLRYSLATLWVTFGAPWVFLKTGLAEPEAGAVDANQEVGLKGSNSKNYID